MPNPALSDQLALQQLFQEPMQPLNTYSQGALAIAMQDRARRQQLQDQAQQQQFQLQRDQSQSALVMAREQQMEQMRQAAEDARAKRYQDFQLKLEQAGEERANARLKMQWEHADAEGKKKILQEREEVASRMGLPLPDENLTQDEKLQVLDRNIGKANAKKAMDLINAGRSLNEQFNVLTQSDEKQRADNAVTRFLLTPAASKLTADEQKQLKSDPSNFFKILARLKQDNSKAGKAAAQEVQESWYSADVAATEFFAGKARNPEAVAKIKGDLELQRLALHSVLSDPTLPAGIYEHVFSGVVDKAKEIGQQQKQQQLPPLPGGGPSGATGATTPSTGGSAQRLPPQLAQDPFNSLLGFVRQEQIERPRGGLNPFTGFAGPTPASDLFYSQLGESYGMTPQPIGSSIFSRSPASQIQSALPYPGMTATATVPSPQQNQIASRVLNEIWSNPNNPAHTRFLKWLQDNAATQNAIAPTAFPSPQPYVAGGVTGAGF